LTILRIRTIVNTLTHRNETGDSSEKSIYLQERYT